jgi:hypothetical protein
VIEVAVAETNVGISGRVGTVAAIITAERGDFALSPTLLMADALN